MDKAKQNKLEAKGWHFGSVTEFLQLTPEEEEYIEIKLRLSRALKKRRMEMLLSQHALAASVHSSQSRIAKMERSDATVSIDLLVRTLLNTGVDTSWLSRIFAEEEPNQVDISEHTVTAGGFLSEFDTASLFGSQGSVQCAAKTYEEQMQRVQQLGFWTTASTAL